jgi:prepilin-type N-terminal cleavage/methylation domain-containing protein
MPAPRPSRRARCRADRRRRAGRRAAGAAFTLVELLVAITIIAAVLAIAIGGLFSNRDTNRLLATEQLVADMVRQARHTTRSSGEPVELHIIQVADASGTRIGGRISGVSRQAVWSQTFDDPANLPGAIPLFTGDLDPATGFTYGRSGYGLWPATSTVSPALMQSQLVHPLTKAQQLVRGSAPGGADAFYLACCVRPPPAVQAWQTAVTPSITPLEIPLVLLGDGNVIGQPAPNPPSSTAPVPPAYVPSTIAGLKLVLCNLAATNATPAAPGAPSQYCWELRGWVNLPGGAPGATTVTISSLIGVDQGDGPQSAIVGGRWEDLGLLYDGINLQLFRDGHILLQGDNVTPIQVAANAANGAMVNCLAATDAESVFYGEQTPAGSSDPLFADAPIDDIRIFRLATEQSQDLPMGVVPEWQGVLEFRPDGTMMPPRADPLNAGNPDLPALQYATALPGSASGALPAGTLTVYMGQGTALATTAGVAIPTLAFCKRIKGLRDGGPLCCAVVTVPISGPVVSALGTLGRDVSSTTVYLVTAPAAAP